MGYNIQLTGTFEEVSAPKHKVLKFLSFVLSRTEDVKHIMAEMDVTFNYNEVYYKVSKKTLREILDGKVAESTIPELKNIVAKCGTTPCCNDGWHPCDGNAGKTASRLLEFAEKHPKSVWSVYS